MESILRQHNIIKNEFSILGIEPSRKSKIQEHPFPLPHGDFISISFDSESGKYKYLHEVVDLISPMLLKLGIFIVDTSMIDITENQNMTRCPVDLDFNKIAYVISNSMLHISNSDVYDAMSYSMPDTNFILFANGDEYTNPFERENATVFSLSEKPENVANRILEILDIPDRILVRTIFSGRLFKNGVFNIIPDGITKLPRSSNAPVAIRLDIANNYQNGLAVSSAVGEYHIVIDKTIPPKYVGVLNNAKTLTVFASLSFDKNFIKHISSLPIKVNILYDGRDKSEFEKIKILFFDFESVKMISAPSKKELEESGVGKYSKLRSHSIYISRFGIFNSPYHWRERIQKNEKNENTVIGALDDEMFLRDVNYYILYELDDTNQ